MTRPAPRRDVEPAPAIEPLNVYDAQSIFAREITPTSGHGPNSRPAPPDPVIQSEHLVSLLANLPMIVFRLNRYGIISSDQGGGLKQFGASAHSNVGRSVFDVFGDDPRIRVILDRALAGERFTERAVVGNRVFDTRYEPLVRDGQPDGTVGVAFDVTEQAHAERLLAASEQRYRLLVDTAAEGIVATDESYRITFANRRLCEILGYTEDELLGNDAYSFVHHEDQEQISRDDFVLWGHRPQQFELHFATKSGSSVPTLCSSRPLRDDHEQFSGILGLVADVSERAATEATRRQLEHDIANAEAKEQQRLSRALHDGPIQQLAAVNLKLGTLRRTNLDRAMANDLNAVEAEISDAVRSLRLLMFDIEACDPTDVTGAIRSCAALLFTKSPIEVQVRGAFPVVEPALANTVYRIAREALVNAHKHSEASRVTVTLGRHLEGIWVSVLDNGLGIRDTAPNYGAFGLRSMLDRAKEMGGLASVEPAPGSGTAVYAWLPNQPQPSGQAATR